MNFENGFSLLEEIVSPLGAYQKVGSSIGVHQASCECEEGPVLFLFIIQAALVTTKWLVPKPQFRTRVYGVTLGERSACKQGATSFDLWALLYTDDCAILFRVPR
jgi:hypothetical protein